MLAQPFRAMSYPWRLYCGTGALDNLPAEVARHGARRAFVICGQSVAHRTNLLQRVREQLGEVYRGVFDRMDKDSSYRAVRAATEAARAAEADLIIAVGGGSVIVGARATVILLAEKGSAYELMTQYPEGKPPVSPRLLAPKLPIVNVLTTPTTAMNRAGTVSGTTSRPSHGVLRRKTRPVALFWDAEALLTAPLSLARSTGTTTSRPACTASPPARRTRWSGRSPAGVSAGQPRAAAPDRGAERRRSAHRAVRRGVSAESGRRRRAAREGRDWVPSAAYALATALHIRYDHVGQGEATSAVTPAVVRRLGGSSADSVLRMAEALGVARERSAPEAAAAASADALDAFYRTIDMPARVRDLGIPEEELTLLARDTLKNFNANRGARPADHVDQMLELLRACW
jgi:alcohol dehydrogenase class IV